MCLVIHRLLYLVNKGITYLSQLINWSPKQKKQDQHLVANIQQNKLVIYKNPSNSFNIICNLQKSFKPTNKLSHEHSTKYINHPILNLFN